MVHFASIRHPASILDDLHGKVLNEVYQISKSTVSESVSDQYQHRDVTAHSVFNVIMMNVAFSRAQRKQSTKYLRQREPPLGL